MPKATFDLGDIDGRNGFVVYGAKAGDESGYAASMVGDVNHDGRTDLIICAPAAHNKNGESYLLFGQNDSWPAKLDLAELDHTQITVLQGSPMGTRGMLAASFAGDMNHDGIDDFLIGAATADPGGRIDAGESYLYFGKNGTWPASIDLNTVNGHDGVIIRGIDAGDHFGKSVSNAGDVNGDGFPDFIIGAYYANRKHGEVYLVFGRAETWPKTIELSELNQQNGVIIRGFGQETGNAVAGVGDVNGDGIDDFIIGAWLADSAGRTDSGECYLIFGKNTIWPAVIELSHLGHSDGVVIRGVRRVDRSGTAVSNAGDVNGDGIHDILISADLADALGRINAGSCYILFGRNRTWPAVIELADLNGEHGFAIHGAKAGDRIGHYASSAGDINQDGYRDIIIGNYTSYTTNPNQTGVVYVIYGSQGPWPAYIDLAASEAQHITRINGIYLVGESGDSIGTAGDINGDGADDVLIGARNADPEGRTDAGATYILYGGSEHVTANQLKIQRGGHVTLGLKHMAVDPLIATRRLTITNLRHGRFSRASNTSANITTFTQGDIQNEAILFTHDGSDEPPSYLLSAEGITRIFSDVRPQPAQTALISTTTTSSSSSSQTITTWSSSSQTLFSATTLSATTSTQSTLSTTSATLLSWLTSAGVATLGTQTTSPGRAGDERDDSSTDSTGMIAGIVVTLLVLLTLAATWYYRKNKHSKCEALTAIYNDLDSPETYGMTTNPMHALSQSTTTTETIVDDDGYVVDGYHIPADEPTTPHHADQTALDDNQYVLDTVSADQTALDDNQYVLDTFSTHTALP